jgi:hypothetical protein
LERSLDSSTWQNRLRILPNKSWKKSVFRFRIQHFRLNTNKDPDPEFWWTIIENNLQLKNCLHIFLIKTCNLLQPSKEIIQHLKTWNFLTFSIFMVIFALLDQDSESGSTDLIESGSETPEIISLF